MRVQKVPDYTTSLELLATGYKKLVGAKNSYTNLEEDRSPLKSINLEKYHLVSLNRWEVQMERRCEHVTTCSLSCFTLL